MPNFLTKLSELFVIKTENLKAKYKGSDKEQIMNTIFDKLDAIDSIESCYLDKIQEEEVTDYKDQEIRNTTAFFTNWRDNILENGGISLAKIQKLFGQNVSIEDVAQAFNDMLTEVEIENKKMIEEENTFRNSMISSIDDKNLPEDIKQLLSPGTEVKITEYNGKKYYSIKHEEFGITIDYNEKGERISVSQNFNDEGDGAGVEIQFLDEKENVQMEILKFNTGLIQKHDFITGKQTLQFGKTTLEYEDTQILNEEEIMQGRDNGLYKLGDEWKKTYKNITVNTGLPNETKLDFEYDENGNIKDIKFATDEKEQTAYLGDSNYINLKMPPIGISDKEKQNLIDLLNNGARLGNDFELKINGNKIEVTPTILDSDGNYVANVPNAVKNDAIELLKQGFKAGKDYKITQNKDGTFKIDLETQRAMNYEGNEKFITYSKDGKTKQTTITNNDEIKTVTTDCNGNTTIQIETRSDKILAKLLEGDFNGANKFLDDLAMGSNDEFNIYKIGLKYQEKTGKNLMQEAINLYKQDKIDSKFVERLANGIFRMIDTSDENIFINLQEYYDSKIESLKIFKDFDPYKTKIAKMLPEISAKEQITDKKYTQKVNGKTYTVELCENVIKITRDNKTVTLNISGIHPNLQKNIMNANPKVLFRLAEKNIPLAIKDQFESDDKITGGTYNLIEKRIELYSEIVRGEDLNETLAHECGHSYYDNTVPKNKALEKSFAKEYTAWKESDEVIKSGRAIYCTMKLAEFVADAYTLLTTGNCDSAYTICKHFPETLAHVKDMIEKEDK